MGKCRECGKGGLFHPINKNTGLCGNCTLRQQQQKLEEIQNQIDERQYLLDEINKYQSIKTAIADMKDHAEGLAEENAKAQKALETATAKTIKLKALAKSITQANAEWVQGGLAAAKQIDNLEIESLLPEQELQCMTMKNLRSRYNSLRKQVVDLCKTYEGRYTTKTNAALYKLTVLALESDLEATLSKLRLGGLEKANGSIRAMAARYYSIAIDGNQTIAPTLKNFIGQIESLYLDIVATEYEYYAQRERAKEEQKALKEQMRLEAEERKQLEAERKKVEAEEKKYCLEIERLQTEIAAAKDEEIAKLRARLEEVKALIIKVEEKKAEIINLQNGKAGTIYVISNIGSFGESVFKVGMTRRLEPMDRVKELSNASVPFPFDVHSFIFSEDAPALETALHKELNSKRVNKVNLRKEFFNVSIDEIRQMVEKYDPTAFFNVTAAAEQYRQSLNISIIPDDVQYYDDDEDEAI